MNTILPATALSGAARKRIDAVEVDDLAGDALRAGRAAVAERRDDQLLREGRDDLGAFRAARPDRHVERLDVDVGEAHRRQFGDGPVAGARLGFGRREALADFGRQPFDDVPGIMIVRERIVAQRGDPRIGDDWRRQASGWTAGARAGRGGGEKSAAKRCLFMC